MAQHLSFKSYKNVLKYVNFATDFLPSCQIKIMFLMNGNVYDGVSDLTIFTMPIVALSGALFGAFLIYILAFKKGINSQRILLIGIGINIAFTSILTIFQLKFTTQEFNRVIAWTSGSIWGSNWKYKLQYYLL